MKLLNLASNNSFWRGIGGAVYDVTIDKVHPRKSVCNCPFAEGRRVICKHTITDITNSD